MSEHPLISTRTGWLVHIQVTLHANVDDGHSTKSWLLYRILLCLCVGVIPESLGQLSNCTDLDLSKNQLTGKTWIRDMGSYWSQINFTLSTLDAIDYFIFSRCGQVRFLLAWASCPTVSSSTSLTISWLVRRHSTVQSWLLYKTTTIESWYFHHALSLLVAVVTMFWCQININCRFQDRFDESN